VALGRRTMWPVIGVGWGSVSAMLYRGRSARPGSIGLRG
jgi:hypothetical protein